MDNTWVELRIRGVRVEGGHGAPVVLLEDSGGRYRLHIPVGPFEASAVIMELEGICPPRPMTHDLLAELFREAGFVLDRVELFGLPGDPPRARLAYRKEHGQNLKEIRPSDALALALRLRASIVADATLIKESRRFSSPVFGGPGARVLVLEDWKQRSLGS
ncbi:MAG TPA: bifunctional nuclease domain-containing protein [Rectinemataceae bacterium]|nr:bifunctional nuclease domain-containing protein [Rectinemataceae bacterium]